MYDKAKPPPGEHSPLDREVVTETVHDWINTDCPLAGKDAIHDALVTCLVDRIMAIKPGNVPDNDIFPIKKPEPPIEKPEPPKPPDLIQPKPPDLIKPPEKPPERPIVKPPDLPIAKPTPKRGMESKTNHAIKRSKPKAKAAKPTHKKPSKHK
jgi:hypothetical protein